MFKKLVITLGLLLAAGLFGFALWLWPDYVARTTTLKTLNAENVTLTDYTDVETARQLEADNYRVVLDSDNQGSKGVAAYAMKINGVEYWVELKREGNWFPRETLKRISVFQPDGSN